jgi:peptidoglycan/xylan/chitin deacetylase (PgdA/CDA1 family)
MIGIAAKLSDHEVIREFFELFKIEWEFERPGISYDVIIRSPGSFDEKSNARLVIFYGTGNRSVSSWGNVKTVYRGNRTLVFGKDRLPIYGPCLSFPDSTENELVDELTRESAIVSLEGSPNQTALWIGYDLWNEIRYLLTNGQPELFAEIPALELHIELLRGLLGEYKVSYTEVAPVPAGYKFIACLTHDVDHASLRAHKLDRTIAGFVYRAAVQSFFQFCGGRRSFSDLLQNWAAVISLPFVQLGLLPDIWGGFEKYADIEEGMPTTFFVIPKAEDAGRLRNGSAAPKLRAVRYTLGQISGQLRRLAEGGHEIGLHGIDAWLNEQDATAESAILQNAVNGAASDCIDGVRMHWLYYDQASAKALDDAGFRYDSTIGYNRTIGYRSGTCQVYKPLGAQRLKELPLHVMDTALFFPGYMNLSPVEAKTRIKVLISNALRFGGILTINWHDRSIAPERLWHRVYADIVTELKSSGAWFATASRSVAWFEKRRAFSFDSTSAGSSESNDRLPGLRTKKYGPAPRTATVPETAKLVSRTDSKLQLAATSRPLNV